MYPEEFAEPCSGSEQGFNMVKAYAVAIKRVFGLTITWKLTISAEKVHLAARFLAGVVSMIWGGIFIHVIL